MSEEREEVQNLFTWRRVPVGRVGGLRREFCNEREGSLQRASWGLCPRGSMHLTWCLMLTGWSQWVNLADLRRCSC